MSNFTGKLAPGETNFISSRPLTQAEADELYFPINGDLGQADFGLNIGQVNAAISEAISSNQLLSLPDADQRYLGFDANFGVLFQGLEIQFQAWLTQQESQIEGISTGLMAATLQEIENHRNESPAHSWGQISEKPNFDLLYRPINIPIDWASITGKPIQFTPTVHALTHAAGGDDPITPGAIGAELFGAATAAIAAHLAASNPHPQYADGGGGNITYNIIRSSPAFIEEFDDFLQNAAAGKLGWTTGNQNGGSITVPGNGFTGAKGVFGCVLNGTNQVIGDFSRNRLGNFPIIPQVAEGYQNLEIYGVVAIENVNQTELGWSSRFGLIDAANSNIDGTSFSILIAAEFWEGAYSWIALWRSGNGITERRLICPVIVGSDKLFSLKIRINPSEQAIAFSVDSISTEFTLSHWGFGAMAPVFQIQRLAISASSANRRIWGDKFLIRENVSDEEIPTEPGEVAWNDVVNKPDFNALYRPIGGTIDWSEITNVPPSSGGSVTWNDVLNKPTTFVPSAHTHPWGEITSIPTTASRWPAWSEVTEKPTAFTPDAHAHLWEDISDKPMEVYTDSEYSTIVFSSGGLFQWQNSLTEGRFFRIFDNNLDAMLTVFRLPGINNYYRIEGCATATESTQNYSFGTGWRQYSATFATSYRRLDKLVVLSGLVERIATSGTLIATLPAGYRPPATRLFGCQSSQGYTRVDINTSGQILLSTPNPTAVIGWISLDQISFFVA